MAQQIVEGRAYDTELVFAAVAAHLRITRRLEGDIKEVFRKCYQGTGTPHTHLVINKDYATQLGTGRLPHCVFHYYKIKQLDQAPTT